MNEKIVVKKANGNNMLCEIQSVGFDSPYSQTASEKYKNITLKIFRLKSPEANILKQLCLSLGFDCAVSRDTITCKTEYTDCVLNATHSQLKKLINKLKIQPFRCKDLAKALSEILTGEEKTLLIREKEMNNKSTYLMGILNVTPDSFSDGGNYKDIDSAIHKALELIEEGADIIDIGGESTRPGATSVSIEEEISRIIPVIKALREKNKDIIISVDTRNFLTAKSAIEAGADIINDVTGLDYDNDLLNFVCGNNIPTIIMHSDKIPAVTYEHDKEYDVVEEVYKSLFHKIELLKEKGMSHSNIIIDPGIGFGKSITENFELLKRIDEFSSLNCLILAGISRKSFLKNTFNLKSNEELDEATASYDNLIATKGVNILRVHNIKLHKKQLEYIKKIL